MSVEQLSHLLVSVEQFAQVATEQGQRLIALADETGKQTDRLVTLTKWIIALTVILGVIAVVQLVVMLREGGA